MVVDDVMCMDSIYYLPTVLPRGWLFQRCIVALAQKTQPFYFILALSYLPPNTRLEYNDAFSLSTASPNYCHFGIRKLLSGILGIPLYKNHPTDTYYYFYYKQVYGQI